MPHRQALRNPIVAHTWACHNGLTLAQQAAPAQPQRLRPLSELRHSLDETTLQVNSEIWMAELASYSAVKEAARRGVAGAQPIADDLGQHFPTGRRK